MKSNVLIIIPARMESKRFPGKPLVDINGKPMLLHVWEKAIKSNCGKVLVACCDQLVKNFLTKKKIPFVMTKKNLSSGTDRVFEALHKISKVKEFKYVINLQGDLPDINPKNIKILADIIKTNNIDMATLVAKIKDKRKIRDKNIVKVALSKKNNLLRAIYFSRAIIPFNSDIFYEHIGIYAYNIKTLKKFTSLQIGDLEKKESLEQLRALENDIKIYAKKIDKVPFSIDTPKDLKQFLNMRAK